MIKKMKVKMLKDERVHDLDEKGVTMKAQLCKEGEVHEIEEKTAKSMVKAGIAQVADKSEKTSEKDPVDPKAGKGAPENKGK